MTLLLVIPPYIPSTRPFHPYLTEAFLFHYMTLFSYSSRCLEQSHMAGAE